jgi:hypothetical protein
LVALEPPRDYRRGVRAPVLLAGVAVLLLAGCGGGRHRSSTSATTAAQVSPGPVASAPAPALPTPTPCIAAPGFGGLGASVDRFDANNNGTIGRSEPSPGGAWYAVVGTARGCVTAYTVQDSGTPPLGTEQLLVLVAQGYLPRDAKQIISTGSCTVWQSTSLRRATGLPYAKATAVAQSGAVPGRAVLAVTLRASCAG